MSQSIKRRFTHFTVDQQKELRAMFTALLADVTAIQTDLGSVKTAYNATLAKLDADITAGGASETNYAATNPIGTLGSATHNTTS